MDAITHLTVNRVVLVFVEPCLPMKPGLLKEGELGPISEQKPISPLGARRALDKILRSLLLLLRWHHDSIVVKGQERHEATVGCVDHGTDGYASPLSNVLRGRRIAIVTDADEKHGKLLEGGKLWDVRVVVEHRVVLDELHEAIKNVGCHA
jgi:hypothetical protein